MSEGVLARLMAQSEAKERISTLLCPIVEGAPQVDPPASATIGACYLVATGGTGVWQGQDSSIACFTVAGWRFVLPIEGLSVVARASGETFQWRSGAWEEGIVRCREVRIGGQTVLRERQPGIENPVNGSVIDSECRTALSSVLNALRTHGLID